MADHPGPDVGNRGQMMADAAFAAARGMAMPPRRPAGCSTTCSSSEASIGSAQPATTANTRSAALLERVGIRREGHLLESTWSKGEWTNDLLYAVLRREWPTGRSPLVGLARRPLDPGGDSRGTARQLAGGGPELGSGLSAGTREGASGVLPARPDARVQPEPAGIGGS